MITTKHKFHFEPRRKNKKRKEVPKTAPVERIPRIARLMALAIKFDSMLREGLVTDQAELARLGHVSRARLTQIMDLNLLAPDIQEAILLETFEREGPRVCERELRPILAVADWRQQREIIFKRR